MNTLAKLKHPFFVMIGPSGSGKTVVSESVFPKGSKVISHTTRPPRKNEIDGIDYYFETESSFDLLVSCNQLLEHDTYQGYRYGLATEDIIARTTEGIAYNVLTYSGFVKVSELFGSMVIPIFFDVTKESIRKRLLARGDSEQTIQARLDSFLEEIKHQNALKQYQNYHCINANLALEQVISQLREIVKNQSGVIYVANIF